MIEVFRSSVELWRSLAEGCVWVLSLRRVCGEDLCGRKAENARTLSSQAKIDDSHSHSRGERKRLKAK